MYSVKMKVYSFPKYKRSNLMLGHSEVMFVRNVIVSLCCDKFPLLGLESYFI